jgi:hypothetical protein
VWNSALATRVRRGVIDPISVGVFGRPALEAVTQKNDPRAFRPHVQSDMIDQVGILSSKRKLGRRGIHGRSNLIF